MDANPKPSAMMGGDIVWRLIKIAETKLLIPIHPASRILFGFYVVLVAYISGFCNSISDQYLK